MDVQDLIRICFTIMIVGGIVFVAMLVASVYKGAQVAGTLKKDDGLPVMKITGKVLEKDKETIRHNGGLEFQSTVEWLIVEDQQGNRQRVRNTKPDTILVAAGDEGEFLIKGETVYAFFRKR